MPEEYFPYEWKERPDEVRDFWLNYKHLIATEFT
ncbi:hypothetical protein QE429_000887 [Bacillus sp. SORGH_AS 510]|nr:hypothetical protein [Bacillus sp. SORGH_AS_0510]